MRVAAIGRTEIMYSTIELLIASGYEVPLILTSKAAPESKRNSSDFEVLANKIGAKYIYTSQINSEEIIREIKSLGDIDICVSINYTGVMSQNVISLFKHGVLNAHAGDLPRYRGNACQAWAIINGENQIGLCVYKMKGDYLDGGELISREYFPITLETRIGSVWSWLEERIPELFLESISLLKEQPDYLIEDTTKSLVKPMRCYPRIPEDGKIDWSQSAVKIIRLINASSEPFSGAYCEFQNEKLIIWKANLLKDDEDYLALPGQVSNIGSEGFIDVITGDGKITITEVEYRNTRTSKPSDFITSIRSRFK